jgi:hypothetical protein
MTASFDAWDTLIARRSVTDIHDESDNLFPIRENVAKVKEGDIIVSDYYDAALLQRVIPEVTGLTNRVIVTDSGKRLGTIWQELPKLTSHTDDNKSCIASAKRAGITGVLTELSHFTPIERRLLDNFPSLAKTMREARLTTFDPQYRAFELAQIEINFPMLFIASIMLHRLMEGHTDLLMSGRDCFLWQKLQEEVREMTGGTYRTHYFLTSRIARLTASPSYLKYVNTLMGDSPVVVDLCGYGRTLPPLVAKTSHPNSDIHIMAKYDDPDRARTTTVKGMASHGNSHIERLNLAPHPMVVDVSEDGKPVYSNPANVDWVQMPEMRACHSAFRRALDTMEMYLFSKEFEAKDAVLKETLDMLLNELSSPANRSVLKFEADKALMSEEQPILDRLAELESPTKGSQSAHDARTLPIILTRLHCEMPYFGQLAVSDGLTSSVMKTLNSCEEALVGSNSEKMARDCTALFQKQCFYLPSIYDLPAPLQREDSKVDNVACFGRVFPLKNITTQAIASLSFSKTRNRKLRFHINDCAESDYGKEIIESLKVLFDGRDDAELVLHKWQVRSEFLKLLATMTIGLQVSLTEASNVMSLDYVAAGLPIVVSPEVKWADPSSVAYPTDADAITARMFHAMNHPELIEANRTHIQTHNEACFGHWKTLLGESAKVVFLVHKNLNSGISTVAENDCAMLVANGVRAEIGRSNFSPDAVRKIIKDKQPTHIISEASWKPMEALQESTQIQLNDVTVVIKTFNRREALLALITSIKQFYPTLHIIVADDSTLDYRPVEGVEYYKLPADVGLSAGRNFLVSKVKTEFTLLLDDDHIFDAQTKIELLLAALGDGFDLASGRSGGKDYCGVMKLRNNMLRYLRRSRGSLNGRPIYDITWNFFVARTAKLRLVKWDESLCLAEHSDWFLRAKDAKLLVTHVPEVNIQHSHALDSITYKNYRRRAIYYAIKFFEKYDLTQTIGFNGNVVTLETYKKKLVQMEKQSAQPCSNTIGDQQ